MSSTASASLLPQCSADVSPTPRAVLRTVIASATADAAGSPFAAPAMHVPAAAFAAGTATASDAAFAIAAAGGSGAVPVTTAGDVSPAKFGAAVADATSVKFAAGTADLIDSGIALGALHVPARLTALAQRTGGRGATPGAAITPATEGKDKAHKNASRWWGLLLPLAALAAAELAVRSGALPASQLPSPSAVAETIADLARNGLAQHISASTLRVLAGFGAGAVLAIALGAAVGLSRRLSALLDPAFQALRAIPSLAWVPLLLLWLGIDEAPKIVLIAIGAFFPVYMGVASGIRDVDRKLIEVGRLYRLNGIQLARRVLLPASLPAILTGLRNGLSLAWMFMVAAELIAASKGLGYLLSDGRETSRADIVIAAIVLLAILGKISDGIMHRAETRLLYWRDSYGSGAAR